MSKSPETNDFADEFTITESTDEESPPKDKCRFIYLIFFFIGAGTLLPWNFFITATQYFQYQLRNRSLPADVDPLLPEYRTSTQTLFTNYLSICSMVPLALTNFLNLMIKDCIPAFVRLITSAVLVLLMFSVTVVLTKVETEINVFMIVTLVSVVFINIGSSINQGSTYGILSFLPSNNARGFLEGQAVAGIIAAVANIITIAAASSPQNVGLVYFLIAVVIIAFVIGLFFVLFRNPYFLYYWKQQASSPSMDEDSFGERLKKIFVGLWHAMWEVRWTGIVSLLTFATTLTVFPSMFVLVAPQNIASNGVWEKKYFHAVTVFLSFNVCDYLGRMLVGFVKWPKFEQRIVFLIIVIIRIGMVPLVMFCNIQPRHLPIAFYHDAFPIIFVIIIGLTNGYFVSLAVNYAPRYASKGNEESCGIATATYITLGLSLGVAISYGLVAVI